TFYKTFYQPNNCKIFIAGKFDAIILDTIIDTFSNNNWKSNLQKKIDPSYTTITADEKKLFIENDPNSVQGAIRMAKLFPQRHHPDYAALIILNTVFGGYFGSRLMSNIREEKGYTYGIYAQLY